MATSSQLLLLHIGQVLIFVIQDDLTRDPANEGSMFVPMILRSDKIIVSVATGYSKYWPLYGSIGNIHNNVQQAHGAGVVLIGFLAIPKGLSF